MAALSPDPSPLQLALVEHLTTIGLTRYRLSEACGWTSTPIYKMLSRPTNNVNLERMLAAVGAKIVLGERQYEFRQTGWLDSDDLPEFVLVHVNDRKKGGRKDGPKKRTG